MGQSFRHVGSLLSLSVFCDRKGINTSSEPHHLDFARVVDNPVPFSTKYPLLFILNNNNAGAA